MNDNTQTTSNSLDRHWNGLSPLREKQNSLIGNLSHELRTPLTLVYGYMESIYRRSENLTNFQKDALEIAMVEMRHTLNLLQESLDLARLDRHSTAVTPILLSQLVKELIAQKSESRQILLEENASNIVALAQDELLKQVLSRLLDNAIRYSHDVITIKIEELADRACIIVSDRGCGIPQQDLPYIFNPFYRVDKSRNRLTGGAGLGLAIVKELVEGMHGTISVDSQLDSGSNFKIILKSSG